MAGFCVAIVEKDDMLDGSRVAVGDRIIGLASSGVHSNGFSLVRKIVAEGPRDARKAGRDEGYDWAEKPIELGGKTLGEVLLQPTQLYVEPVLAALKSDLAIHGMAHITGGGLPENLPRCLGQGQSIQLISDSWPILPVFEWLRAAGNVSLLDMFHTFNMGIGFAVIVPPEQADAACQQFAAQGVEAYAIGTVITGNGELLGL